MKLQPKKTNLIEFGKISLSNNNVVIRCINKNLKIKKEAKFLGIMFDSNLKFENQCRCTKEKVIRVNSMFRYINKVSRGIEVNTSLLLYKSLIRSIIDYGSAIFVSNNDNLNRQYVEKAQFAGLRSALGYRNSTPTNVIIAEAKVTSTKERAKLLAKNLSIKLLAFGEQDLKKDNRKLCNKEVRHTMLTP